MHNRFLWVAPITLLLLSFFPWPYGYYTFLRILVTGIAVYLAWVEYSIQNTMSFFSSAMSFLAVLFNPILPIYFPKSLWGLIDVLSAVVFMAHGIIAYTREQKINLKDGV